MTIAAKIESLLFVSPKPLTMKRLADLSGAKPAEVDQAITTLLEKYNQDDQGINLVKHGPAVQFVSSPLNGKMITDFLKEEQAGELTRPALETLTIIAYRGPISKIQLDTIRGVNCALILRNLMIKGLIDAKPHKEKLQTSYHVTMDFLRFIGLNQVSDLPDYDQLNHDENLEHLLNPSAPTETSDDVQANG